MSSVLRSRFSDPDPVARTRSFTPNFIGPFPSFRISGRW